MPQGRRRRPDFDDLNGLRHSISVLYKDRIRTASPVAIRRWRKNCRCRSPGARRKFSKGDDIRPIGWRNRSIRSYSLDLSGIPAALVGICLARACTRSPFAPVGPKRARPALRRAPPRQEFHDVQRHPCVIPRARREQCSDFPSRQLSTPLRATEPFRRIFSRQRPSRRRASRPQ